jgi:uncharacterized protein (DUF58 family)
MHVLLLVLALLILWPIAHGVIAFIGAMLLFALRFWVLVIALIVVAVSWPSITSERERSRAWSWREESAATEATPAAAAAAASAVVLDIPGEALRLFGSTQVDETGGWPVPSPHPIEEAALVPADQETSVPHDLGRGQTDRAPAEISVRAPASPPSAPTP